MTDPRTQRVLDVLEQYEDELPEEVVGLLVELNNVAALVTHRAAQALMFLNGSQDVRLPLTDVRALQQERQKAAETAQVAPGGVDAAGSVWDTSDAVEAAQKAKSESDLDVS